MRVVFLIKRVPAYRLFAPIIEDGLARGWDIECWHDQTRTGESVKKYQFPSLDCVPPFSKGRPHVEAFRDPAELSRRLATDSIDAVVATQARDGAAAGPSAPSRRAPWIVLQHFVDLFAGDTPENLLSCESWLLYSRWWLEWAAERLTSSGAVGDREVFCREARPRSACVGMPELDAERLIDRDEVRRRWRIPPAQPVVVLFPFPQGVGRDTFWPKHIFGQPSRGRQLARIAYHGRFEYLADVWHGRTDREVVRAVRRFCDRNGAFLLVKSRLKTPVPAYLERLADRCVYDESLYPGTILEALSIAALSIGHFTASVMESAALGVPHVCLPFNLDDYLGPDSANQFPFSRIYNGDEGGAFQFQGVSTVLPIAEALATLPDRRIDDFAMDAAARTQYVEKFLSVDDRQASVRANNAVERLVQARPLDPVHRQSA